MKNDSENSEKFKAQTLAIHTPFPLRDAYNALSMPVYHTAAYEFESAEAMADAFCGRVAMPDYSRVMNPTVNFFENKMKALTGAANVVAFNSGMAAISNALLCLGSAGKNIVTSRHLFGNTFLLITQSLARFSVGAKLCDLTNLREVEAALDSETCCLFLEILTNPQLEVADISALSVLARRRKIPLVADTTAIPFTEFRARDFGVDIEIVSSTKYLSGGATSLGGLVIDYGNVPDFGARLKTEMLLNFGAYMTPHAAYMQTLGLETLDARYRIQAANALALAKKLRGVPAIRRATNLFDSKTLAIHPAGTIFGNFSAEQRAEMGISDKTIRISVGLEDVEDLFADIARAARPD